MLYKLVRHETDFQKKNILCSWAGKGTKLADKEYYWLPTTTHHWEWAAKNCQLVPSTISHYGHPKATLPVPQSLKTLPTSLPPSIYYSHSQSTFNMKLVINCPGGWGGCYCDHKDHPTSQCNNHWTWLELSQTNFRLGEIPNLSLFSGFFP